MIWLLCLGKMDFEAVDTFRNDLFFSTCLGISTVPSEGTVRQWLYDGEGKFDPILKEESADMVARHARLGKRH